jgi:hypothetical protein
MALSDQFRLCVDRGIVESVSQPIQPAIVTLYPESNVRTVAGDSVHDVSVDASRGM